ILYLIFISYDYFPKYYRNIECKLCSKRWRTKSCCENCDHSLCKDCYQVSSGSVESTLTKKHTLILYLPWWDNYDECLSCSRELKYIRSDSQKWCSNCITIYIGCRYCLTTNVIFGVAGQSQCMKCKRVSSIAIDTTNFN